MRVTSDRRNISSYLSPLAITAPPVRLQILKYYKMYEVIFDHVSTFMDNKVNVLCCSTDG